VKPIRIALVSAFPPSRRPLSEYAWHLVQSLQGNRRVEHIHVLADRADDSPSFSNARLTVHRCWTFDGVDQPVAIARAVRRLRVDAVWCNLHLTSAGNGRASWFAGFLTPLAARAAGITTIVTLHNMLGFTDVSWAGPETTRIDQFGAHVATRLLRPANAVCVLVPEYVGALRDRYRLKHVRLMPLGTLGTIADGPAVHDRDDTLLAFGHFGSYKRLEDLIEVMADFPDCTLTIAGTDSRHTPGYLASLHHQYRRPNVVFLGYLPERDVPHAFKSASLCVLPYATTSGMSSVAIQAAMHGVPIVASDIPGFRSLSERGLRLNFFTWGDRQSLSDTIARTLSARQTRQRDALHNLEFCRSQKMDAVVDRYLDLIEGVLAGAAVESTESEPVKGPSVVGSK